MIVRRRILRDGKPLNFSCQSGRYRTDVDRGEPHGSYAATRGCALRQPLADRSGYTLWLEHVVQNGGNAEQYWLVWYDPFGAPATGTNGVLDARDLLHMSEALRRLG
jgi:hypothetical protein